MENDYKKIQVETAHDGQVVRIVLATPPANILDGQTMKEICSCLDREAKDPGVKALVFEGQGKHFSFGASVEEHQKDRAAEMIRTFHGMFKQLLACQIPTVALVRGQCLGGGLELVMFCNFIIAQPRAKFGQPEIQLAVLPPVAAAILPGIVGQLRADDIVLSGRSIDAETAQAWGLVHTVAEDGEAALEQLLTEQILPKSAAALRLANKAVRWSWNKELPQLLDEMEQLYVQELMETQDAVEGIAAFLEKRPAAWKNR